MVTTCPDAASADRIARALVEGRLAACANVLPGARSTYIWEGAVETAEEHVLLIKTRAERYPGVERTIQDLHPYELPEVIAIPVVEGDARYLSWIDAAVSDVP